MAILYGAIPDHPHILVGRPVHAGLACTTHQPDSKRDSTAVVPATRGSTQTVEHIPVGVRNAYAASSYWNLESSMKKCFLTHMVRDDQNQLLPT
uniref:Uncharacterized protein n=1 Tax=Arundo donax TaxID=35708 RepID=A0A0A9AIY5_ARUDO